MENNIESIICECCGLTEDCTQNYINETKSNFAGKWLCGLCSEAVKDEISRRKIKIGTVVKAVEEAVNAHMLFCGKFKTNPAELVANGMRQMLRRRSSDLSSSRPRATTAMATTAKKFGRSNTK